MSVPYTLVLEIAFEDFPIIDSSAGPPEVPAWFDVSEHIRGEVSIVRGRASELDKIDAGTMSFTLTNANRVYDPDNINGVYYGNIVPGRKVRFRASVDAVHYPRFVGFITSWNVEYLEGTESYAHVTCVDATRYLNMIPFSGAPPDQPSNERIHAVLNVVTGTALGKVWPTNDRDIAIGEATIPAEYIENETVLQHILKVTEAEEGLFFIGGNGDVVFQNRGHRYGMTHEAIFSNKEPPEAGDLPWHKLVTSFDDTAIFNQVQVTRRNGIVQVAQDITSQNNYFIRYLEVKDQLYVDDAEALAAAKRRLAFFKEPEVRIKTLVVNPQARGGQPSVEDAYAEVLEREISDHILVTRKTLIDGNETTYRCFIERIEDTVSLQKWLVSFTLSPVHLGVDVADESVNTTDDWHVPALLNGWSDFGAGQAQAGFRREGPWVYLRGYLKGGLNDETIFLLPVGYRPPDHRRYVVVANPPNFGYLFVNALGEVKLTEGDPSSVDIGQVAFRLI